MSTTQEKVSALSALMANGILTLDEFSQMVKVLKDCATANGTLEKSPREKKYEDYVYNHIAYAFKSPSSVKAPPLTESMIKQGELNVLSGLKYVPVKTTYIETYIDAPNSYGTMLRKEICIVVDNDFNPQYVLENVPKMLGGKSNNWVKMAGIR